MKLRCNQMRIDDTPVAKRSGSWTWRSVTPSGGQVRCQVAEKVLVDSASLLHPSHRHLVSSRSTVPRCCCDRPLHRVGIYLGDPISLPQRRREREEASRKKKRMKEKKRKVGHYVYFLFSIGYLLTYGSHCFFTRCHINTTWNEEPVKLDNIM